MKKILDISEYQRKIDFKYIKKNYGGVIIRVGYGNDEISQDDKCVLQFVKQCNKLKIPYGFYLYSYAKNTDMVLSEIEHVKRVVNLTKGNPTLPIFLDIEERCCIDNIVDIINCWCNEIYALGYDYGIYSSASWYKNYIKDTPCGVKWVAQYNDVCEVPFDIWQFTDSENVNGVLCDASLINDNYSMTELNELLHFFKEHMGGIRHNINTSIRNNWNSNYAKMYGSDYINRLVYCMKMEKMRFNEQQI